MSLRSMSVRRALERDLLPPGKLYVSNCLSYSSVLKTKSEADKSLGRLAGEIRAGINKHGTREQIEAYWNISRKSEWPLGAMPVFFGASDMHQIGYSNWTKVEANLNDFSAACVSGRDSPLYPSFVSQVQGGIAYPDGFIVTGRDTKGNYWLEGTYHLRCKRAKYFLPVSY